MKMLVFILIILFIISGCAKKTTTHQTVNEEVNNMKLESEDFEEGKSIPKEFTCDGDDISPKLVFKDIPEEAKSLALIMDDPDAPGSTFVHWIVWNIPPDTKEILKGEKITYLQGRTGFGSKKYGGPCPPSGTHRYFFKLYALDTMLSLGEESTKAELKEAMEGHVVSEVSLMGTYQRS